MKLTRLVVCVWDTPPTLISCGSSLSAPPEMPLCRRVTLPCLIPGTTAVYKSHYITVSVCLLLRSLSCSLRSFLYFMSLMSVISHCVSLSSWFCNLLSDGLACFYLCPLLFLSFNFLCPQILWPFLQTACQPHLSHTE